MPFSSSNEKNSTAVNNKGKTHRSSGGVTLEEVAKLAGVSPITVSRVLNQPGIVAPATIEKVQNAISRTGYVPNLLAGALASRRSRLIAAIIPSIVNPIYAESVRFLIDRLRTKGYEVLLGESGYTTAVEEDLILAILSRRPDGIFLTGTDHSAESRRRLLAARIPVVESWDLTPTPLDVVVGFSHEKVGREVAAYLFKKGYRRFAVVTANDPRAQIRLREFKATLDQDGIKDVPTITVPVPSTLMLGRNGFTQLLDMGFKSGVIFCSSDTLAHGVLIEATSRKLSIPEELAIMGFGDQSFSAHTHPAISTVWIDRAEIGRRAAEALLERIDGGIDFDKIIDLGFQVKERGTT